MKRRTTMTILLAMFSHSFLWGQALLETHDLLEYSPPNDMILLADGSAVIVGSVSDDEFPSTDGSQELEEEDAYFVMRVSAEGQILWAKVRSYPGMIRVVGHQVRATDEGNLVLLIEMYYAAATESSGQDALVTSFSSDGNFLWETFLAGEGDEEAHGLAIDGGGNIYVGGTTMSDSINGWTVGAEYRNEEVFVAKLDSAGALEWVQAFGSNEDDEFGALTLSADGHPIVSGRIWWSGEGFPITHPESPALSTEGIKGFLVEMDFEGQLVWSRYLNGVISSAAAVGPDQAIWIVGIGADDVLSGMNAYQEVNPAYDEEDDWAWWSPVIYRFDREGYLEWGTFFGGEYTDYAYGIVPDETGGAYIGGTTSSDQFPVNACSYEAENEAGTVGVLFSFDAAGNPRSSTHYSATLNVVDVAIDPKDGTLVMLGSSPSSTGARTQLLRAERPGDYDPSCRLITLSDPQYGRQVFPEVSWHPGLGRDALYEVEVAENESFSNPLLVTTEDKDLKITHGLSADTQYYWRVRMLDRTTGERTDWSETGRLFTRSRLNHEEIIPGDTFHRPRMTVLEIFRRIW